MKQPTASLAFPLMWTVRRATTAGPTTAAPRTPPAPSVVRPEARGITRRPGAHECWRPGSSGLPRSSVRNWDEGPPPDAGLTDPVAAAAGYPPSRRPRRARVPRSPARPERFGPSASSLPKRGTPTRRIGRSPSFPWVLGSWPRLGSREDLDDRGDAMLGEGSQRPLPPELGGATRTWMGRGGGRVRAGALEPARVRSVTGDVDVRAGRARTDSSACREMRTCAVGSHTRVNRSSRRR